MLFFLSKQNWVNLGHPTHLQPEVHVGVQTSAQVSRQQGSSHGSTDVKSVVLGFECEPSLTACLRK